MNIPLESLENSTGLTQPNILFISFGAVTFSSLSRIGTKKTNTIEIIDIENPKAKCQLNSEYKPDSVTTVSGATGSLLFKKTILICGGHDLYRTGLVVCDQEQVNKSKINFGKVSS